MGNLLIVIGASFVLFSLLMPIGEQNAFAKRSLQMISESDNSDCRMVLRGQRVTLLPSSSELEVRLANDPDCVGRREDFSTIERRPRRGIPPYSAILGFEYKKVSMEFVNARYEPVLAEIESDQEALIAGKIYDPAAIEPKYLVTGSDGMPWIEAEVPTYGVVYFKCNRLRVRLANGRIARTDQDFCRSSNQSE